MDLMQVYIALLAGGLLLLGIEIFLPGGILGMIGGLALLVAMVIGFKVFGADGGMLSAVAIVVVSTVYLFLVMKFLPHSPIGRMVTLTSSTNYRSMPKERNALVGQQGETQTDLRPGGFARINGKRVDVVAEGGWIEKGARVTVVGVEGARVVVREVRPS